MTLPEIISSFSAYLEPVPVPASVSASAEQSNREKKPPVRAVLFDLYGTLFISEAGDISTSKTVPDSHLFSKALKLCGLTDAELIKGDGRNSIRDIFYRAIADKHADEKKIGNKNPEVEIRDIWDITLSQLGLAATKEKIEEIAVVYESIANRTWPMPGLAETLSYIREKGLIMGIISNAQFYTRLLFEAYLGMTAPQLGFNPGICYYSYETGTAKPGIDMFEKASLWLKKEKNISADEVLYIGNDMLNDIKTAFTAGMQTCLFAGDRRSLRLRENNTELSGIKPDYVITELCSLRAVLNL